MELIQWPQITIGGREFRLAFTWMTIRALREVGVDFFNPFPEPAEGQSPVDIEVVYAKFIAAAVSTVSAPRTWEWVMENALPHELVRMVQAINEAREKVSALSIAASQEPASNAAPPPS